MTGIESGQEKPGGGAEAFAGEKRKIGRAEDRPGTAGETNGEVEVHCVIEPPLQERYFEADLLDRLPGLFGLRILSRGAPGGENHGEPERREQKMRGQPLGVGTPHGSDRAMVSILVILRRLS